MSKNFPITLKFIGSFINAALFMLGAYVADYLADIVGIEISETVFYQIAAITLLCWLAIQKINSQQSVDTIKINQLLQSVLITFLEVTAVLSYILIAVFEFDFRIVTLTVFIQYALHMIWTMLLWRIQNQKAHKEVLIVGNEEECIRIIDKIQSHGYSYSIIYTCQSLNNADWKSHVRKVDSVIVAPSVSMEYKQELVHYCLMQGKQPLLVPEIYELFFCNNPISHVGDIPVVQVSLAPPNLEERIVKRIFDLAAGGIILLLVLPLCAIIALLIKSSDKGPIFYSQRRVGRNEKEFTIYKFRTMVVNAESITGPVLAQANDPRITKVGKILRATRMDELPQLLNVMRGDMSIVGPRPERPVFVEKYKEEIAGYGFRHYVKPGITGLAQINSRYTTSANDKLVYDLAYIPKYSIVYDLYILFQTVRVLLDKDSSAGEDLTPASIDVSKYRVDHGGQWFVN